MQIDTKIKANSAPAKELVADIEHFRVEYLRRLAMRGHEILKEEVPGNGPLKNEGVKPPLYDFGIMRAEIVVSQFSKPFGGMAAIYNKDGEKTKEEALRPQPPYDYAPVVARGNKEAVLYPREAAAFIIPVPTPPADEGYLIAEGHYYIVRRSRRGQLANPFDVRSAERLVQEAPAIAEKTLKEFV